MVDEQQMEAPRQLPFGMPQHNSGSNILYLTNPEPGLNALELSFRQQKIVDGKIVKMSDPLMTEEGIASVMGQVGSLVDQLTIMADVDDQHLVAIWENFNDTLVKDLMMNRVRYGIKSSVICDIILNEAANKVWTCLLRARNGGDRRFWKGSVLESHSFVQAQPKQGMLARAAKAVGWS